MDSVVFGDVAVIFTLEELALLGLSQKVLSRCDVGNLEETGLNRKRKQRTMTLKISAKTRGEY